MFKFDNNRDDTVLSRIGREHESVVDIFIFDVILGDELMPEDFVEALHEITTDAFHFPCHQIHANGAF